jgi:integrase
MASITERSGKWRALVRMAGHSKCATFSSRAAAKQWAARVEGEIEELRASGIMQPRGLTVGDLIDRYTRELYPAKQWGRSKSADLAVLKKKLGHVAADKINAAHIVNVFRDRHNEGAGPVTISAQAGYLVGVLKVARSLWHLDVPVQAAQDARSALCNVGLVGKSNRRDRRVTDAEIAKIIEHFEKRSTQAPYADLVRFAVATGMRISEVCRLSWRDLNESNKTIVIRERKHPRDKLGNDQVVPLLDVGGFDAFAIAKRQPRGTARIFPFSEKTISSVFPRHMKMLGLEDLHLHDLRHEAISRLFEAGYRIEQVALVSGHRDWGMLRRYTHVRAADLHRKPLEAKSA